MKRAAPIRNSRRKLCAIFFSVLLGGGLFVQAQEISVPEKATHASQETPKEKASDILELLDGSALHGRLRSIDSSNGLSWEHLAAKRPIEFTPENLAWVRFPEAGESTAPVAESTCQFQFSNGDEFFGNLLSLDENEVEMQTWFGGKFKTPRATLRSIRFYPKGAAAIYEGPTGMEGWHVGKTPNPEAWRYEDGGFVSEGAGTLGRDLNLPDASRIEFDLAWSAPFSLLFSFYTGMFDGFNYNSSSYMFYMTAGNISLQRINAGTGSTTLGRTETIPAMVSKRKVHLEFRGNKEENFLEVLADGKSVAQWKDTAGWVGKGSGILFYTQTEGGVRVSNIKVSSWDGKTGLEVGGDTGADQIFLANRDRVTGKVASLRDGKLKIAASASPLEVPLARITQISFANVGTNAAARAPWEIQASLAGGGRISFALEKWNSETISGQNKNFGRISLNSKSIRQIQFNLHEAKVDSHAASLADDVIWEANEQ